ncbi:hypothetical protein QQ045_020888 [Rhodiola kirilowii]
MLNFKRDHLNGSCTCLASIFHSFKNLGPLRDFASRIKDIIPKFTQVRESNQRYRTDNPSLNSSSLDASNRLYNPRQDALLEDDELVGIKEHKRHLIDMLVNSDLSTLKVVSVYGMGGVGKTSLVKELYDDKEVKRKYTTRAWITVSQTFEPNELFKNLIGQLQKEPLQPEFEELGNVRNLELKQKAKEILRRNTYLVVLDDIWSIDAWNAIRNTFPDSPGSRLLITTRNNDVALAASNGEEAYIFKFVPLSKKLWLHLFCKKTFNTNSCPEDLAEVTQSILKKCDGVPLAILAISGVLVTKDRSAIEWEKVNRNLGTELVSTKRVLSLSYADLPYHLKPCYLYLSIFPEDHLIQKHMLIRLWIAEGFVKRTDTVTVEDVAESYLKELVQRSLIQVSDIQLKEQPQPYYYIHDLLREIINEKAKNQDFAIVARENNGLWPQEEWRVRRLSLHSNMSLSILQERQALGKLRSLFMFGVTQTLTKSSVPCLFSLGFNYRLLNVLDMEGTVLNEFPTTIVKLINLKYLNLSRTDVERVPSSIGSLLKLETLDLSNTRVTKLPSGILNLQRLDDLRVSQVKNGYAHGFKTPAKLQGLQSLRSLLHVDAGPGCENVAKQIGMLTQLRHLGITNLSKENTVHICSSINNLHDLQILQLLSSQSEDQAMDLQHLVLPSQSIGFLYLRGKLESLPPCMALLKNLVTLCMHSSKLQRDPIETLGRLPKLVRLELIDACNADILQFKAGMLGNLKVLLLHKLEHLVQVIFEDGTTPNLIRMEIRSCPQLKMVSGIIHLQRLKQLKLYDVPSELFTANDLTENEGHIKGDFWIRFMPVIPGTLGQK